MADLGYWFKQGEQTIINDPEMIEKLLNDIENIPDKVIKEAIQEVLEEEKQWKKEKYQ